jgi:ribosome-binding protein aMBF1 (putative translation factor)
MSALKSKRIQKKDSISAMKRVKRTTRKRSSKTGSISKVNSTETVGRIRPTVRDAISEIQQTPSVESLAGILNTKQMSINAIEREQLKKLRKSPNKLMLDE